MSRLRIHSFSLSFAILLLVSGTATLAGVATTTHNLSVSGPGPVKADSEAQICLFCHAPHNASPDAPLWNRQSPGTNYTPYSSSTASAIPGQPTGASLLCLSCHDGTIALGDVLNRSSQISFVGGVMTIPTGTGRLGTDLSDDHPISFSYTTALAGLNGQLVDPSTLTGPVKLDENGELQCTACHDPHDDTYGDFLVMSNTGSALCIACHVQTGWDFSTHRTSNTSWNNTGPDPWPHTDETTVAGNACENCHRSHSAGGPDRLLNEGTEELNCTVCHNGNAADENVESEFFKFSTHPISDSLGIHDPTESGIISNRHVECVDCHNPHAARDTPGTVPGSLAGVRGISSSGIEVAQASHEYEICFRCHADSIGQPAPATNRQIVEVNTRLEFDTANPSHHAVLGPGNNPNVPSLIPPLNTSSVITCGDCHNNNDGPGAGGSGPAGSHGSTFPWLLERRYDTADNTQESAARYALCYKCHNRDTVLNGGPEKVHKKHVKGEKTPCNVCHDPHGISTTAGNAINNSKLINFDTDIVFPRSDGDLRFVSLGTNKGSCYLVCHDKDHKPLKY